jgi:predicted F0F1-ATPase subunit
MEEKKNKKREYVDVVRLTSVGFGLVIATMIGYFFGVFIDKHTHTTPIFTLIFLLLGIAAGIINVFRTLGRNNS